MKIAFSGAEALRSTARDLRDLPEASQRAATRAVNAVTAKLATQSRRDIGAQINLPQSYIRDQMTVTKATRNTPQAAIRMRMRAVRLARFAAQQRTAAVKHPKRSKGDASRGIAAGRKQAGVSVAVVRGDRKRLRGGFFLPLRAGKVDGGNGLGVFIRTGRGRDAVEHKYGPSPDQLFRRWMAEQSPDIQQMLVEAYDSQLRFELTGKRK